MKISVITVCYNAIDTIEETLQSVIGQDYSDLEYIVVDGASIDGTLALLERYEGKLSRLLSEKDTGVYDAMNKGIALATGDVVAILNGDDVYASAQVLSRVASQFIASGSDTCYGDLQYVDRFNSDRVIRHWISGVYDRSEFLRGWMPPHPAFFAKARLYQDFGSFNLDFKTSADYELMLRFLMLQKATASYIPEVLVRMKMGGQSNNSLKNRVKANREDRKAWIVNGLKPKSYTFWLKPLRKLKQFRKGNA